MYRFFILVVVFFAANSNAQTIDTIFGPVEENNQVILELLNSKAIQRLKYIDQSGPEPFFDASFPSFNRYDHSLGVYALLKKYNVSTEEQIAGLMHDASHTVFSHSADLVFQSGIKRQESYQDSIHDWFLQRMAVDKILAKYNLTIRDISPKNPSFIALEQPFPDMNADRIEYNLHTGLVYKDLSHSDVTNILNALQFNNNKWYFTDIYAAKKFAKLSTYYTKTFWGNAHNAAIYSVAAAAIKYALHKKLIVKDDLHFGADQKIVDVLTTTSDPQLKIFVNMLRDINKYYVIADKNNYDIYQPVKMRGIDPLVLQAGNLRRLSSLSLDFKHELELTQANCNHGIYIKFTRDLSSATIELLKNSNH